MSDYPQDAFTFYGNFNKDKKTDGLGCLLVFLFYIVFSIGFVFWGISLDEIDENNLNEIKLFLKEGKLEEARRSILLLPDDRTKGKGKTGSGEG